MYAMVEIKGNQYKAEKGELLTVDVVASEKGDVVEFDSVLLLRDDKNLKIGIRGDKVIVHKYKRRKRYKRTRGHRQHYTVLRVEEITG